MGNLIIANLILANLILANLILANLIMHNRIGRYARGAPMCGREGHCHGSHWLQGVKVRKKGKQRKTKNLSVSVVRRCVAVVFVQRAWCCLCGCCLRAAWRGVAVVHAAVRGRRLRVPVCTWRAHCACRQKEGVPR
jgi:hypothetical protein